jgi:uncharacterized protein
VANVSPVVALGISILFIHGRRVTARSRHGVDSDQGRSGAALVPCLRNDQTGNAMTIMPKHDLLHEFPEFKERIHQLKMSDMHFARLFAEYHEKDHEIHRMETGAEHASDMQLELCKKQRLYLKDELYAMLQADMEDE